MCHRQFTDAPTDVHTICLYIHALYNSYTTPVRAPRKKRSICASICKIKIITVLASYNKLPAPASDSAASPSILWASSCTHGGSAMGSSSLGHRAR